MSTAALPQDSTGPHSGTPDKGPAADIPSLARRLAAIVGERRVLARRSELFTYTADGLPGYRKGG